MGMNMEMSERDILITIPGNYCLEARTICLTWNKRGIRLADLSNSAASHTAWRSRITSKDNKRITNKDNKRSSWTA